MYLGLFTNTVHLGYTHSRVDFDWFNGNDAKGEYCALILGNVKLLLEKLRKAMNDRFKKEGSNTGLWLLTTTLEHSKQDRRKQLKIMRVVSILQ